MLTAKAVARGGQVIVRVQILLVDGCRGNVTNPVIQQHAVSPRLEGGGYLNDRPRLGTNVQGPSC